MKTKLLLILVLSIFYKSYGQPVGKQLSVNINIFFYENIRKDTLLFDSLSKSKFISIQKEYVVSFYSKKHHLETNKLINNCKTDFNQVLLRENKFFDFWYYTSIEKLNNEIIPTEDIIVLIENKNKKMKIYIKLYNEKQTYDLGKIFYIPVLFKEGNYNLINLTNPKFIPIIEN